MPRISDERRAAQRRRIIDAMLASMRSKGLAEISMSDVIATSGLSAGAIYSYFASKEEIVAAVGMEIVDARVGEIAQIAERSPVPPPAVLVRDLIEGIPDQVLDAAAVVQVWGAAATRPELRDRVLVVLDRAQSTAADYLSRWYAQTGREDAQKLATVTAPVLVAVVQGYIVRAGFLGRGGEQEFLRGVDLLLADDGADGPGAARPRG